MTSTTLGDGEFAGAAPQKVSGVNWRHVAIVSIAGLGPASGAALNLQLIAQFSGTGFVLAIVASIAALFAMIYIFRQYADRISSSGGLYTWSARAWGSSTGFVYGWTFVGAYFVLAACGFPVFGSIMSTFLEENLSLDVPWWVISAIALAYVVGLALRGTVSTLHAAMYLLAFEVLVLIVLSVWALFDAGVGSWSTEPFQPSSVNGTVATSFGLAMTYAIFSYIGIEEGSTLGSEVTDSKRDVSRGLLVAGIFVPALTLFVAYAAITGFGLDNIDEFAGSAGPLQSLAGRYWGSFGEAIFVLALGSSILAWSQTAFNAGARVLFTLGRERVLPGQLARTGQRNTPVVAILVTAVVTLAIAIPVSFSVGPYTQYGYLGFLISIAFIVAYLVTCAGLARLTWKAGDFHWLKHGVASLFGSALLAFPLYKSLNPWPTGAYAALTYLYIGWMVAGFVVLLALRRRNPAAVHRVGTMMALAENSPDTDRDAGVVA